MSVETTSAAARKRAFIHTVAGLASEFEGLAKQYLPDWKSFAIVDEACCATPSSMGRYPS